MHLCRHCQIKPIKKTSVIFNGVSDTHISKANYYLAAAKALGLKPPMMYEGDSPIRVRIVCGNKAKHLLAYKFGLPRLTHLVIIT